MGIGRRIKEARENKGFTQNELAELVGVTGSAITNYEKETSHPKEPIMYKLIDVLQVDANYLFQDVVNIPTKENGLTILEYKIIEKYRDLDEHGKESINIMIDRESQRVDAIRKIQAQLSSQVENVSSNKLHLYSYLHKIACAGTGFYFDNIPTDVIEAPYIRGADFIVGVSGDSMEPNFHDGEQLYVQKVQELALGDTGIFTIGNECFVKELGDKGLISKNPTYDEIPGTEDVRLIGRVLGKVEEQ